MQGRGVQCAFQIISEEPSNFLLLILFIHFILLQIFSSNKINNYVIFLISQPGAKSHDA